MDRERPLPDVAVAGLGTGALSFDNRVRLTLDLEQARGGSCDVALVEEAEPVSARAIVEPGRRGRPRGAREAGVAGRVVTLENEFMDAASLRALEDCGYALFPTARSIELVQDKLVQKETLARAGLPVPRFEGVARVADVERGGAGFGCPFSSRHAATLTTARGTRRCARAPWLRRPGRSSAATVVRGRNGAVAAYPVAETIQQDHVCHVVTAPAEVPTEVASRATEVARQAVTAVGGVGSFGVEMFLTGEGEILVNELAPRVHNSGQYTIEACACSQFENHVRAVLGWPLGDTTMVAPAAAMVNLLGADKAPGRPHGIERALAVRGAHVHVYGKAMSGPGRKMGHVTALGATPGEALADARRAAGLIRFGRTRVDRHDKRAG